ncbi:MAG: hypothetical protein ACFFBD_16380 [Candidatus Hodarchaeota archaeon]
MKKALDETLSDASPENLEREILVSYLTNAHFFLVRSKDYFAERPLSSALLSLKKEVLNSTT